MREILTIMVRELAAASGRPQAYVMLGVFIALYAWLTLGIDDVLLGGVTSMRRPFGWMAACLLFLVPAITMGQVVDERRSGRLLLLGSLPLSGSALILGKWASTGVLIAFALALTWPWPVLLAWYGDLDPGPVLGGYLGLWLAGAALAAVGIAASAAAGSQISAFVLALALALIPWLVGVALPRLPAGWVPMAQFLSFDHQFGPLARGVFDSRSLVFFGSICALFLRIAVHALERERLR